MGGKIEWAAIEIIAEVYGVDDIEIFIVGLVSIEQFQGRKLNGST